MAAPAILRAQAISWIGASATPPTDFIAQSLDFFCKRVDELTKGQIKTTAHHAGSLGGEREHVEGLLQGSVHVASPGQGLLAGWYKPAEVWTHPFVFKDVPHKDRVWDAIRADYGDDMATHVEAAHLRLDPAHAAHAVVQQGGQDPGRHEGPEDPRAGDGAVEAHVRAVRLVADTAAVPGSVPGA